MSRLLICPPSRRGHRWIEIPGSRDLAARVCKNCGTPGRVNAQGLAQVVK